MDRLLTTAGVFCGWYQWTSKELIQDRERGWTEKERCIRQREKNIAVPLPLLVVEEKTGEETQYQFQCSLWIGVCIGQHSTVNLNLWNFKWALTYNSSRRNLPHNYIFWRFTRADKSLNRKYDVSRQLNFYSSRFRNFYDVFRNRIH